MYIIKLFKIFKNCMVYKLYLILNVLFNYNTYYLTNCISFKNDVAKIILIFQKYYFNNFIYVEITLSIIHRYTYKYIYII